jgi:hypothetical protein
MLHHLEIVASAILSVLGVLGGVVLWIWSDLWAPPTARDREGAEEAMEEYAKRQRERLKANQDKTAN